MKYLITYWLAIAGMVCAVNAHAQSVLATVDRDKILLGEQVTLQLKSDNIRGFSKWFNLPDSVNHLEVVSRGKIDTINVTGRPIYQQSITLTSFDSGSWQIPGLTAVAVNGGNYSTSPITIDVLPVDVSHMNDYHDIKDILEVAAASPWGMIVAVALITLAAIIALIWLWRRRSTVPVKMPALPGDSTPVAWALAELGKLAPAPEMSSAEAKKFYQQLTDILRRFFYLQLQYNSLHQTTDEWMISIQSLPVATPDKTSFLQLLRLADTVKFARYHPPYTETRESVPTARTMVQRVGELQYAGIPSTQKQKS